MPDKKDHKSPAKKTPKKSKGSAKHRQQVAELTADLQRIQADFSNYKRRAEADQMRAVSIGREATVTALLPVIDNIQRALSNVPADLVDNPYVKGLQAVSKQLDAVITDLGVKKIKTVGEDFDPETMEAVAYDNGDGEREVVIEELQAGYRLEDTVIRHAMVKVAKQ